MRFRRISEEGKLGNERQSSRVSKGWNPLVAEGIPPRFFVTASYMFTYK
jgi:hypothetical protein